MLTLEEKVSILNELTSREKENNRIKKLEHEELKKQSEVMN